MATDVIYLDGKAVAEANAITTATTYFHDDALGSPVARTNSAGAVTSRTSYEPYGKTASGTNPPDIGFTGHMNDTATGLVYMQQRYYDPLAGRFLSLDPSVTNANSGARFGRFSYAENNPYLYVDPDGEASIIASLVKLTARAMQKGAELSKAEAVAARRAEQNVKAASRQAAKQIEEAAHGKENPIRHKGHDLGDGETGDPHFQTDGKKGHTFWSGDGAIALASGLDSLSDFLDAIDPLTYLYSDNSYVGLDGKIVSQEELLAQIKARDEAEAAKKATVLMPPPTSDQPKPPAKAVSGG